MRAEPGNAADGGGATVVEGSAGEDGAADGGAADGSGDSGDCPAPETGLLAYDTTSNYSLRIGAVSGATQIATPDGQASNTWVHVAAVFDPGKRMELWVDGARLSNATTPPVNLVDNPTAPLRVGCLVTSNYFKGKLDELRLYGRALQATEIQQLAR